jgi:hypothetical protein
MPKEFANCCRESLKPKLSRISNISIRRKVCNMILSVLRIPRIPRRALGAQKFNRSSRSEILYGWRRWILGEIIGWKGCQSPKMEFGHQNQNSSVIYPKLYILLRVKKVIMNNQRSTPGFELQNQFSRVISSDRKL